MVTTRRGQHIIVTAQHGPKVETLDSVLVQSITNQPHSCRVIRFTTIAPMSNYSSWITAGPLGWPFETLLLGSLTTGP